MISQVIHIPHNLLKSSQSEKFEGEFKLVDFKVGPDDYVVLSQVTWNVQVANTGNGLLYISGKSHLKCQTKCARCLEDFDLEIDGKIEAYSILLPSAKLPNDVYSEECIEYKKDHTLDIGNAIYESICLELPLRPLCDDECSGIKINHLNKKDEPSSPFEVLKDYKFD